ncbi:hypothetical protein [Streptomyces sp. NBC_01618]|uniref:hypothetical protein n=1 Tax=Streptomyces sp. NBC_01618 TaxID=2975900 RepID=UPI00386D1668
MGPRPQILDTGGYGPIRRIVAHLAADAVPEQSTVVDVGCGTGYYLAGDLEQLSDACGLGLDTSARALSATARAHERAAAAFLRRCCGARAERASLHVVVAWGRSTQRGRGRHGTTESVLTARERSVRESRRCGNVEVSCGQDAGTLDNFPVNGVKS